jgi:hypothetical protein
MLSHKTKRRRPLKKWLSEYGPEENVVSCAAFTTPVSAVKVLDDYDLPDSYINSF